MATLPYGMTRREPFLIEHKWPAWVRAIDGSGMFCWHNEHHATLFGVRGEVTENAQDSLVCAGYYNQCWTHPQRRLAREEDALAWLQANGHDVTDESKRAALPSYSALKAQNEALMAVARAAYMACTEDISEPDTQELWECLRALPPELRAKLEDTE